VQRCSDGAGQQDEAAHGLGAEGGDEQDDEADGDDGQR